jgi:two-component system chemotaxis response regulator CheB
LEKRNIIVIGASAGGFEAIRQLVAALPATLDATIFIVWHMAPDVTGVLPQVLNRQNTLPASNAVDNEPIKSNHIYVAPPDKHLLVDKGVVRVTRGPKENRFRPAVDPLFRSAAELYGRRVIGIILSGALDDGTAGLWTIKSRGGLAIVQEPAEAAVSSMPESALAAVDVDYRVPMAEMAPLLVRLAAETVSEVSEAPMEEQQKTFIETRTRAYSRWARSRRMPAPTATGCCWPSPMAISFATGATPGTRTRPIACWLLLPSILKTRCGTPFGAWKKVSCCSIT